MTIIFLALLVIFLPLMPAESQDNGTKLQASKLVQIISPQAQQNFYTGNLKNFVQVLFATKIEVQQPICLLDMDSQQNVSVPGKVQSATMVSCDLSSMEPLSVGRHQLWVVRSPDLLESTLSQQTPVQLNILASPGAESAAPTSSSTAPTSSSTAPISSSTAPTSSSTAPTSTSTAPTSTSTAPTSSSTAPTSSSTAPISSSTAPTSSSTAPTSSSTAPTSSSTAPTSSSTTTSATDILTLTPVAATFDNQMGQVLVQLQRGGIDGKSVDGKMELDCELLMQNLSQLGENPKCRASFVGTNFTLSLQLGQNASLHPGDILGLYPLKVAGDSGSALSFEVARNQGDLVFLPVAGPANPGIPVISLVADTRRISLCPSVADSQLLFNVSDNSGNAQILTCKWAARIPNSILNSSATSNLAKVVPANNSNCSLTLSNKAIAAIFSNFSDLSSKTVLELSVVACNSAGLCSSAQSLSLPVDSNPKLDVQIVGAPASTIAMARVPLSAKINYSECDVDMFASTEQNMSFIWLVNGSPVANNTSIFTIPAYSLASGNPVQVKFVAKHENGIETSDLRVIEYQLQPIVPVLDSTAKSVTVDRTLLLDASASWSPNVRDWPLDHSWSCLNLTDGTKCQLATLGGKSGQLIIAAGKLQENRSFLFTDTIRDSFNSSVQVQIPVNVLPSNCPTVTLTVEQKNAIPLGFVHVKAVVRSPITIGGMLTLQWLLYRANGDSQEQMDLASHFPHLTTKNVSTTQTLIVSFSLPIGKMERFPTWPGLEPDQYYSLRLSATNGKGAAAFAERRFRIMALPPIQELLISPSHDLASLDTLIRLQPSLLNSPTTGRAYRVRFGIRYLLVNGESRDVWARASTGSRLDGLFFEAYLPTAWPQPHASCGQRIGYQGLLEVCDRIGGQCSRIASSNFTVGHFSMDAMGRAVKILRTRLDNGDLFGALELLDAVNQEVCGQWKSAELLDQIFDLLVDPMTNNTDSEQLLESLDYGLRLADAASAQNLQKFTSLLNRTRRSLGMSIGSGVAVGRTKRQATTSSSKTPVSSPSAPVAGTNSGKEPISKTAATTLLIAYDVLLAKDQSVVDHYLLNIRGILSSFCTQVDGMTTMQAFGRGYTSAQAQGIVPGQPDFLNQTFSLAGNISLIVSFDSVFASLFASWWCGIDTGSQSTCTDICLGSAVTNMQALRDNEHLRQLYFLPQHAVLSVDQSVSNLYHIYLMDPLSGTNVSAPQSQFSIRVNMSITNYVPSTYYRCFFFTGSQWDDSACDSASSPKLSSPNQFQLLCTCHRANGILGVFSVNPPAPPAYPPHNEIQLFFTLATSQLPSGSQISSFFDQLSKATTITRQRFVQLNATMVSGNSSRVSARLRPPFRSEQLSNSYSMQALKRTIQCDGGFLAYDNVLVLSMNDTVLKRSLIGDGHARRIPLRISRSFKEVVGPNYNDTSSTTFRWLNSMATNMRISEFRFKNPAILMGMLFNFTITVPFDGESAAYDETPLAAEEIAKLIEEMTYYGELDLRDQRDQPLPIEPLADSEVAELIVVNPTGPMTFVLGSIVGAAITLTTLFIGTLVCLKVRSDRLIVQRNENMHTIDLSRASQITNVVPFHQRTGSETVFGTSRRRAGGQIKVDG